MKIWIAVGTAALVSLGCEKRRPESPPEPQLREAPGTGGAGGEGLGAVLKEEDRPFLGDAQIIAGTVEDVEGGSVTLRQRDGKQVTLALHPNTVLLIDGEERTLGELREGTEIRASFDLTPEPAAPNAGAGALEIETLPR